MKKVYVVFGIVGVILVLGWLAYDPFYEGTYAVSSVTDGDTIVVRDDVVIRLIGIDAPEKDECFADESKEFLKQLLDETIEIRFDDTQGDKDTYDRVLGYVFLEDGTNINLVMVENGYAREYTHMYPYEFQEEFLNAEEKAKEEKRGLWGGCDL